MGKEFPVPGGTPFLGGEAPEQMELAVGERGASPLFAWIHYQSVGRLTGILDYVLIVCASILAGAGYHAIILRGDVPDLLPYVAAGNIVAGLYILGIASQGNYSPSNLVSARRQLRSIIFFWSLAFLSLSLFLFLAKSGPDFSRGTIILFGILGLVFLLVSHVWIASSLNVALARATLAGDRAITIGGRETVSGLSPSSILRKAGAREIRRYLLPPNAGPDDAAGLRLIDDAVQFARSHSVDCVLLALQWSDERLRDLICDRLQALPIRVLLLPDQHLEFDPGQGTATRP